MDRRLWILLLLPPVVWGVHLQVCYALHAEVCASNTRVTMWAVSLLLFVIVAFTSVRAYTTWQSMPQPYTGGGAGGPEEEEPRPLSRAKFMAASAFFGSLFFALLILGQTIPTVMLHPCD